jgi:Holliday junction DNA helicase RuvA
MLSKFCRKFAQKWMILSNKANFERGLIMYEYFSGKLIEKTAHHAVIDINGIGYKLHTPSSLIVKLPDPGKMVTLYASWVVREMSQTLYGFVDKEERDLFEQLLTISGIGPKTALNLVGHFELPALEDAVRKGNSAALAQVPGIGIKTAEKLILDLKNKLKVTSVSKLHHSSKIQDTLSALIRLGCSQSSAEQAVRKALEELNEESDLAALITTALKYSKH